MGMIVSCGSASTFSHNVVINAEFTTVRGAEVAVGDLSPDRFPVAEFCRDQSVVMLGYWVTSLCA